MTVLAAGGADRPCDKWMVANFLGVSAAVAREIAYRATGRTDTRLGDLSAEGFERA